MNKLLLSKENEFMDSNDFMLAGWDELRNLIIAFPRS